MTRTLYIFPGRFQPLHNGHIDTIRTTLSTIPKGDKLIIAVIIDTQTNENPIKEFENIAKEKHKPDRNPLTSTDRLTLIKLCCQNELKEHQQRILPIILPRPETNWDIATKILEGNRVWVIPNSGDRFDDLKEVFFKSLNETVIRVKSSKAITATYIRASIKQGNKDWEKLVPVSIINELRFMLNV